MDNTFIQKASAWLRQSRVWGFFLSMAIMAVIAVAFFAPDNFEGNTLRQADIQQGIANGHEGALYYEATGEKALWTNSLFSGMPTFQISPSYPSNSLFEWLDSIYGLGLPAPSNLLFMMMFGFFILMYAFRVRWQLALLGAIAWGFSSYYITIIGAGHIWKFETLAYIPPTIAGLVIAYRGGYIRGAALVAVFAMLQLNANHPQMSYYFGFVMAGMALAYLWTAIRTGKVRRWMWATVACLAAGSLAVGANLPSIYNTYEYSKETKRSGSDLMADANNQSAEQSSTQRPTGGMPYSEIVGWSYGGSETFSLLIPNIKGGATARPHAGQMVLCGMNEADGAAKYAGTQEELVLSQFPQYFNDSESTNGPVYVGAIICALFIFAFLLTPRKPMTIALVALTILSVALALGRNFSWLTDLMVYHFPLYNKFRAVESILVIAEFTMPLLAVLGIKYLTDNRANLDWKNVSRKLYIAFGIPMAICALGILAPGAFGSAVTPQEGAALAQYPEFYTLIESLRLGMVRSDSLRSFVFLALGLIVMWSYLKSKLKANLCMLSLAALVLIDLYTVDKRYISSDSFTEAQPTLANYFEPDEIDREIMADKDPNYRIIDIPGFGSADRSYFHKRLGGYHAAKLSRYEDLIRLRMAHVRSFGYDPALRVDSLVEKYVPAEQHDVVAQLRADYRVLDMLNARYAINAEMDQNGRQTGLYVERNDSALGNAWFVRDVEYVDGARAEFEALATLHPATEAVADRSFANVLGDTEYTISQGDTIYQTSYSPNRLEYKAINATPATAVFSEIYFPWGWKATIDGKPAELARVNYVLRALAVPAGEHEITMTFDPDSLHTTGRIAYACVTLIYLLSIGAIFLSFRKKTCDE